MVNDWGTLREADVVKQCGDFLKYRGWHEINMPSGLLERPGKKNKSNGREEGQRLRVGEPGCSDKVYMRPIDEGYCALFFCEYKRPGETLRPQQEEWHVLMRERGFRTVVIDSLERLTRWLEENY